MKYSSAILIAVTLGWAVTSLSFRKDEKSISCSDETSQKVKVGYGRLTTLNFPFKPKEVVPGAKLFDFKQMKNDLIILPLTKHGKTNAVVYLNDRRCSFDFETVLGRGDDILTVKDLKDSLIEVNFK